MYCPNCPQPRPTTPFVVSLRFKKGANMPQVIELKSVCRSFGKKPDLADRIATAFGAKSTAKLLRAVDGVDLAIEQGEVLGLVGESGCGKSTLGRLVAGILPHDSGDVLFNGKTMVDKTSQKTGKGLGVQMIFQNPAAALDPRQRILDAITEAPIAHGLIQRSQARSFAIEALDRVGLREDALDRYPHQFSGGQRQRVAIARALVTAPSILLADEPTGNLDSKTTVEIMALFDELHSEGQTLIVVTHEDEIAQHCHRVVEMKDGIIAHDSGMRLSPSSNERRAEANR